MTIQTISLGAAPSGAGGDTFRSTGTKVNENFTNNTHAASRYVGKSAGNLMEVGAFGVGSTPTTNAANASQLSDLPVNSTTNLMQYSGLYPYGTAMIHGSTDWRHCLFFEATSSAVPAISSNINGNGWGSFGRFVVLNKNATNDSNGFIKSASPVVQLFADKISANEEDQEQSPIFEKSDVGFYLIKNTEGFSDNGWYIEMPKDANGNVLVAVQYQQLEDNTIEVKTFAKKFDEETGDIVQNLEKPRDIPSGRWIDIRLKQLPKPEIEIPISNTPPEFQPTNLAQAVAEALKNGSE